MESELARQWNSDPKPRIRLGIFGLLRESFRTINRNMKPMLPVLVLVFLLYSHLQFAQIHLLETEGKDLESQLERNPKLFQDFGKNNMNQTQYTDARNVFKDIMLVNLFVLGLSALSLIISVVFLVATVSSSSEAYTAKVQNFTEMIIKLKKSWKKPTVTSFYMVLFTMGFFFVCFFCVGMVSVFATGTCAYVLYGVVGLSIAVLWIYISALWMMSLVVSVLEDVGGLGAIVRAREMMKGEKVKTSVLVLLFYVAYGVVHWMTSAIVSQNLEKWSRMVISIAMTNGLLCALKLFSYVVFTIFYHEQKESCDEKVARTLYLPIAGDEV
ncbi:hypothetical protein R6Q57_008085 [Mikania cordata]